MVKKNINPWIQRCYFFMTRHRVTTTILASLAKGPQLATRFRHCPLPIFATLRKAGGHGIVRLKTKKRQSYPLILIILHLRGLLLHWSQPVAEIKFEVFASKRWGTAQEVPSVTSILSRHHQAGYVGFSEIRYHQNLSIEEGQDPVETLQF